MPLPPRDVLLRIRKLASLPEEIHQSRWAVSITRLTVLKSLCHQPELANRFVTYLACKMFERMNQAKGRSAQPATSTELGHLEMMKEAFESMEQFQRVPSEKLRRTLTELLGQMRAEQNECRKIPYGTVRLITDSKLLLLEYALSCVLAPEREVGFWVYQTARHYAERYDASQGTGLISSSIPLVQDIIDFWMMEYALTPEALKAPAKMPKVHADHSPPDHSGTKLKDGKKVKFTPRQGQFLAFIHLYRKLHRRGPTETDLVEFFRVTAPAVHGMIVKLEELGLITREPGVARSPRVTIPSEQLPELKDIDGEEGR